LATVVGAAAGSDLALQSAYDHLAPLSIDRAVMEGAAQDHRVVMASMTVGWSDLGGWSALLHALGVRGGGRVVPPGDPVELADGDVLLARTDGHLQIVDGPSGSITTPLPTALLT